MTTPTGDWSIAELKDLITSKDYDQTQLANHYASFAPTWVNQDSAAFVDWTTDWNAMKDRYQSARSSAETIIDVTRIDPAPDTMIGAQSEYVGILTALKQQSDAHGTGPVTKGDFDDLDKRLLAASGVETDFSQEPQPTPGTDWQLNLLNALPDTSKANPKNWPWWAVPAIVVVGGLYVATKIKELAK